MRNGSRYYNHKEQISLWFILWWQWLNYRCQWEGRMWTVTVWPGIAGNWYNFRFSLAIHTAHFEPFHNVDLILLLYCVIHLWKEKPRHRTGLDLDERMRPRKLNCRDQVGICRYPRRMRQTTRGRIWMEMTQIGCGICPIVGFGENGLGHWSERWRVRQVNHRVGLGHKGNVLPGSESNHLSAQPTLTAEPSPSTNSPFFTCCSASWAIWAMLKREIIVSKGF